MEKTCCVTGHRNIPACQIERIKQELRRELLTAIHAGYSHFISGFAEGVDQLFAEVVLELKKEHPMITLEAAIPYRKRLHQLFSAPETKELLLKCSVIGVHSEEYHPECFAVRNSFMVRSSSRVIAVYDGRNTGGTLNTIRAAAMAGRDVRIIQFNNE